MGRRFRASVLALVILGAAPAGADAAPADSVDPIIGTTGYGNTFPGPALPFGMAQPGPDTQGGLFPPSNHPGGYEWTDTQVRGFSQTHLSGTGCNSYGHVPFMPVIGSPGTDPSQYASGFRHSTEVAKPGFYGVDLDRYGIRAELTATERTGVQRYTFPASGTASVLIDAARSLNPVTSSHVEAVGQDTVEGYASNAAFCDGGGPVTVYFSARFSRPFTGFSSWGGQSAGRADFGTSGARQVEARVGISYVSVVGARANREREADGKSFDSLKAAAATRWNEFLSRASVQGGTPTEQTKYYTALYHAGLHPNVASDVTGRFRGLDNVVRTAPGSTRYGNFSLWDTYRNQFQLVALLEPGRARDMALSLAAGAQESGWVARWLLANVETNIQSGDSVTALMVDAYQKGLISDSEARAAYPLLWANATRAPPAGSRAVGRTGVADYVKRGFAPFALSPHHARAGASATLEYALADCALGTMAGRLGKAADAETLSARGANYLTLFDRSTGFFRPRLPDGSFRTPFDPAQVSVPAVESLSTGYEEGSAWQYLWLVPQDERGLVRTLGGRASASARLDRFFAFDTVRASPDQAKEQWRGGSRYAPDNEPDLHAPYLYAFTGQPWKTQQLTRAALDDVYSTGADGIFGNDDLGTESSWYVLSALGLYPVTPGADHFAITGPAFDRAEIRPASSSAAVVITAPGASAARPFVSSLTVNGAAWNRSWVPGSVLRGNATLAYTLSGTPNGSFASSPSSAPPSPCAAAEMSGPSRVQAGQTATFDASASADPDRPGSSYAWDLDGNGSYETAGARVSHVYAQAGTYRVRLRVTDTDGVARRTFRDLTVTAAPAPARASSATAAPPPIALSSVLSGYVRALRRTSLTRLLRKRGLGLTTRAPLAGGLKLSLVSRTRHRGSKRLTVREIALGRRSFGRAGRAHLTVRLTKAGRSRLRRARGRLRLRAQVYFTAKAGGSARRAKTLSIRR